jgi:hypothetical protein
VLNKVLKNSKNQKFCITPTDSAVQHFLIKLTLVRADSRDCQRPRGLKKGLLQVHKFSQYGSVLFSGYFENVP